MKGNKGHYLFTSESVTEGHPDKLADQISDAILDDLIRQDPKSRVAVEALLTNGVVVVAGEVSTQGYCDIPVVVRGLLRDIGYTRAKYGFDSQTVGVLSAIHGQSPDIAQGVDIGGAGDQGMMFGFACDDTDTYMPMAIHYAHRLAERLAMARKEGLVPALRPDGKTQVTVRYEDDRPVEITKVLMAAQHQPDYDQLQLRDELIEHVVNPVIPERLRSPDIDVLCSRCGCRARQYRASAASPGSPG